MLNRLTCFSFPFNLLLSFLEVIFRSMCRCTSDSFNERPEVTH